MKLAGCGCMEEWQKWFKEHPTVNLYDQELPNKIRIPKVTFKVTCKECGTSAWMEVNYDD